MKKFIENLKEQLNIINKEIIQFEDIVEDFYQKSKTGEAVVTDSAVAQIKLIKERIEAKKENYYKLSDEIDRLENL